MPPIDPTPRGVRLTFHVQPRASRTEILGRHGDAIKLRVSAPPVDGAANAAIVAYLAERLELPRSAIELASGETGRRKTVLVRGRSAEDLAKRLGVTPG